MAATMNVGAVDATYRLWAETSMHGDTWTVVPQIAAPVGSTLRYQIVSKKTGHSGRSNTSQSGTVTIGADGARVLATLNLGVGEGDRCEIEVKVFEGALPVAAIVLNSPT
jgi:hypothetical protein